MDVDDLVQRLLDGQRRALARALSVVEDGDEETLRAIVTALHPHTGHAHRVGMTGAPGAGKSTLTSALIAELRARDRRVAVLAVDPSSPFSGGALLGDRLRMRDHAGDDGVFIRSMASRGQLGGLSWAAPHATTVLDAAGFDVIIIETVGVGQAEVEVASLADTTVVVQAPGMGDGIQAAKAGILEIADIHVINKADRPGAARTARELMRAMEMRTPSDWTPPVLQTVASTPDGVGPLTDAIAAHHRWSAAAGTLAERRRAAARAQIVEIVSAQVRRQIRRFADGAGLAEAAQRVVDRVADPYTAAEALLGATTES